MAPFPTAGEEVRSDGGTRGDSDDADDGRSRIELLAMALSVALTLALFGFVAWNAVSGPEGATPTATAERVGTAADGQTLYAVHLANPGDRGFARVTVTVACGDPPRELAFDHVPPNAERGATVVCPAGVEDARAAVVSWQRP